MQVRRLSVVVTAALTALAVVSLTRGSRERGRPHRDRAADLLGRLRWRLRPGQLGAAGPVPVGHGVDPRRRRPRTRGPPARASASASSTAASTSTTPTSRPTSTWRRRARSSAPTTRRSSPGSPTRSRRATATAPTRRRSRTSAATGRTSPPTVAAPINGDRHRRRRAGRDDRRAQGVHGLDVLLRVRGGRRAAVRRRPRHRRRQHEPVRRPVPLLLRQRRRPAGDDARAAERRPLRAAARRAAGRLGRQRGRSTSSTRSRTRSAPTGRRTRPITRTVGNNCRVLPAELPGVLIGDGDRPGRLPGLHDEHRRATRRSVATSPPPAATTSPPATRCRTRCSPRCRPNSSIYESLDPLNGPFPGITTANGRGVVRVDQRHLDGRTRTSPAWPRWSSSCTRAGRRPRWPPR